MLEPQLYSIEELSAQTGVKERNIRFYIAEGLLHPPAERGRYDERHLIRLQFIRKLTEEYVRLDQIRRQLERYTDEEIVALLQGETPTEREEMKQMPAAPSRRDSLMDYLRTVQGQSQPNALPQEKAKRSHAPMPLPPPKSPDRADWERWTIADGIELHARKSLAPEQRRLLDELLRWIQTK